MMPDLIAESTNQELTPENPLLSATLPEGHRVQVVLPPAAEEFCFHPQALAFSNRTCPPTRLRGPLQKQSPHRQDSPEDSLLTGLLRHQRHYALLSDTAVQTRRNILISGGTSTGKTTFLNACLQRNRRSERLVTVEDAREVRLRQPNRVHLLSSRGGQGRAQVTPSS